MTPALHPRTRPGWLPAFLTPLWERIAGSPIGYRLAHGAFWAFSGNVLARALGLLSSIVVARLLDLGSYGELGIIQSTVGMFGIVAGFGMGVTATKFVAEYRKTNLARAGQVIGFSSLIAWITGSGMTVGLIVFAPWLARESLAAPNLAPLLQIASLLLLLGAVNGAQSGALAGFEAFKTMAKINFASGVATVSMMVAGVWFWKVAGGIWGLVAAQAFTCVLGFFALRREIRGNGIAIQWRGGSGNWRVLWHFSLPAVMTGILILPVDWICNTLLVRQAGGYAQMGLYNASNQWFGALLFLPNILGQVVLPVLSERLGEKDTKRSGRILLLSVKLNALITFPLILLGCLFSPCIMGAYGPGFRDAWPILSIILVTAGILAVVNPCGQLIVASGKLWIGLLMNLGWALAFLAFTLWLVHWGALGLASARLFAYLLHALWSFVFCVYVTGKYEHQDNTSSSSSPALG